MFQIGLYDPAEADLELFRNSWSARFFGERLYEGLSEPPRKLLSGRHLPKDGDGGTGVCYCRRGSRWDRQAEC